MDHVSLLNVLFLIVRDLCLSSGRNDLVERVDEAVNAWEAKTGEGHGKDG